MTRIINFVQLIRIKNISIILLIQLLIKFFLINIFLDEYTLNNYNFVLYLFSLLLIVSAGYIINDIYDVTADKINKPKKIIVEEKIKKRTLYNIYISFNIIALILILYVGFTIKKPLFSLIYLYMIISLWRYSKRNKYKFLIGNIQVALLTSLSILNLIIFDLIPVGIIKDNGSFMISKIITIYALFAFITTFIREIIKDIEDIKGDTEMNSNTIPIKLGVKKTKYIAIFIIFLIISFIGYFQYFQYSILRSIFEYEITIWGVNNYAVLYICLIQFLLIVISIKTYYANKKSDFYFISMLIKIIMTIGILSIPLFTFLHIK